MAAVVAGGDRMGAPPELPRRDGGAAGPRWSSIREAHAASWREMKASTVLLGKAVQGLLKDFLHTTSLTHSVGGNDMSWPLVKTEEIWRDLQSSTGKFAGENLREPPQGLAVFT